MSRHCFVQHQRFLVVPRLLLRLIRVQIEPAGHATVRRGRLGVGGGCLFAVLWNRPHAIEHHGNVLELIRQLRLDNLRHVPAKNQHLFFRAKMLLGMAIELLVKLNDGPREAGLARDRQHFCFDALHFRLADFVNLLRGGVGRGQPSHQNGVFFAPTGKAAQSNLGACFRRICRLQAPAASAKRAGILSRTRRQPHRAVLSAAPAGNSKGNGERRSATEWSPDPAPPARRFAWSPGPRRRAAASSRERWNPPASRCFDPHTPEHREARQQVLVIVNGPRRHAIDGCKDPLMQTKQLAYPKQMRFQVLGFELQSQVVLQQPDAKVVRIRNLLRWQFPQIAERFLCMLPSQFPSRFGPIVPFVRIFVMTRRGGKLRFVLKLGLKIVLENFLRGVGGLSRTLRRDSPSKITIDANARRPGLQLITYLASSLDFLLPKKARF